MTNDIDVIIYSYKGKILKDVVASMYSNASKKYKINTIIIDQHPIVRAKMFSEIQSISYRHVFWDWQHSPAKYKKDFIVNSSAKYVLLLQDNVILSELWDETLIKFVSDKDVVVSGNKKLELSQESIFFLSKKTKESQDFELNNFIDRSLIFFPRSVSNQIDYPDYLKYNGEEESLSIDIFTSGIDIYSAPSETYTTIGKSTITELYVPFSINHNYNEVVDLIKSGSNKFLSTINRKRSIKDFLDFHVLDPSTIYKLPFQTNDVEYDPSKMNFNTVDARRFVARTKAIH